MYKLEIKSFRSGSRGPGSGSRYYHWITVESDQKVLAIKAYGYGARDTLKEPITFNHKNGAEGYFSKVRVSKLNDGYTEEPLFTWSAKYVEHIILALDDDTGMGITDARALEYREAIIAACHAVASGPLNLAQTQTVDYKGGDSDGNTPQVEVDRFASLPTFIGSF